MRSPSTTLTGQELEIMKIVWERGSVTVRDVYEALLERRKVAYTTVMTMLKILEQKKYLKKTQAERAHVYRPAQPKGKVIGAMVREFVNRVFNGSAEPLLVHLVEEGSLTRETWRKSRACANPGGIHERDSGLEQHARLQPANRAVGSRGSVRAGAGADARGRRATSLLAIAAGGLPAAAVGAAVAP